MLPQCLRASETGLEFLNALTRTRLLTGVPALDALERSRGAPGLRTGDLVELHGGRAGGSGGGNRQAALRKATATFALPRDCAGHESTVLYFTMDGTFDVAPLRRDMMRHVTSFRHRARLQQRQNHRHEQRQKNNEQDDQAVVESSLRRVIVLTCTDAMDAQFALLYAESLLKTPALNIKLLVFDNIAANFFEHRAAAIAAAHTRGGGHAPALAKHRQSWVTSFGSKFARKLDQLRRVHRVIILTFTPTYFDPSSSSATHLLGSRWDSLRKHRIKV
jgi:hypothetical protein